jgi:hypothetical protein
MANSYVSAATAITIIVGAIISLFYLRYMWLALQRVAVTLNDPDEGQSDSFGHSFIGAIVAVLSSALAISSYGYAPQFLYVGVLLALASPIAVTYTFYRELND